MVDGRRTSHHQFPQILDSFLWVLWTCLICLKVPNSFLPCCGHCFAPTDSAERLSDLQGLRADFKNKLEKSTIISLLRVLFEETYFWDGVRIILRRNHGSGIRLNRKFTYNFMFMHCKSAGRLIFYLLLQHERISINSNFFSVYYICMYMHLFIIIVKGFKTLNNPCIPTW